MKLPTDYIIPSLGDLKRVVVLIGSAQQKQGNVAWNETLEMTKEQYLRYKELVWKEDPIRFYNGMEIKISTEDATKAGDGSV